MAKATRYLRIMILLLMSALEASAQADNSYHINLTLGEAIEIAKEQSPAAIKTRHAFLADYWAFRTYKASRLPSLNISAALGQYNRSLVVLQNSETGAYKYVPNNTFSNDIYLSVDQNLLFTGGTLSFLSSIYRLDQFSPYNSCTYNTNPAVIRFLQPLNGYNSFKWDKQIEPRQYEYAKKTYLQSMEGIAVTVCSYYFNLLYAQCRLENARISRENTSRMYEMAKERYSIGSVSKDELLQLELKLLNDDIAISDDIISLRVAMMKLRDYLGYNESVQLELCIPVGTTDIVLNPDDVMQKVNENSSFSIRNEISNLCAQQSVAKAKSSAGFSANFSAQVGLSQVGNTIGESYRSPRNQEVVGVTLAIPILDWGLGKGRVKLAKSQAEVVKAQIRQAEIEMRESVSLKVLQFNVLGTQCSVSRKADDISIERYESTRGRFINGSASVIELNTAQIEMDEARLRYVKDLGNYWQNYYEIRQISLYDYIMNEKVNADFVKIGGQ